MSSRLEVKTVMAGLPQEVRAKAASPDSQAKEKKEESLLYSQLNIFFPLVTVAKTSFSRNSSIEVSEVSQSCLLTLGSLQASTVCQNYFPPPHLLSSLPFHSTGPVWYLFRARTAPVINIYCEILCVY